MVSILYYGFGGNIVDWIRFCAYLVHILCSYYKLLLTNNAFFRSLGMEQTLYK